MAHLPHSEDEYNKAFTSFIFLFNYYDLNILKITRLSKR